MAHNITPSPGSLVHPITALAGRPIVISPIQKSPVAYPAHPNSYGSEEFMFRKRIQTAQKRSDRYHDIRRKAHDFSSPSRELEMDSRPYYEEDDLIDIWTDRKKRRKGTSRAIFDTGRSVLIGNLGSISKHPKAWCRLRRKEQGVVSPLEVPPLSAKSTP